MTTMTMRPGWNLAAVLAAGAVVLAGCGDGTKAGGEAPPVTLRIGTDDVPGRPSADQIDEFARQVEARSDGGLLIEPVWQAAGRGQADWDQAVAQLVIDGELDLGMIPARSWDRLGVTSLRGLHAPFLVTSDDLLDAVVSDDELAAEMLDGLGAVGITGLALLPEGLRHVFSFGDPLIRPDAFDGGIVRAPTSDTTYALWEAFGATVEDFGGPGGDDRFAEGIDAGSVIAAESAYVWAGTLRGPTTATANATPFPKVNVIAANTDVFDGLSDEHQQVLRAAAAATRDWAVATNRDDGDHAAEYCANGGTIVLAGDDDLAALRAAAQVVYDDLEQDEATARVLGRIGELAATVAPPEPIEPCGSIDEPDSSQPSSGDAEGSDLDLDLDLDGVYRFEVTYEHLADAGVPESDAYNDSGTFTATLSAGRYTEEWEEHTCTGRYSMSGSTITVRWETGCRDHWTMTATVEGDVVRWSNIQALPPWDDPQYQQFLEAFYAVPWVRIGDVDASEAASGAGFPDGAYRMEITAEQIIDVGVDRIDAVNHAGTWTLTFDDGELTVHDVNASSGEVIEEVGVFCVDGPRVILGLLGEPPACGDFWSAGWTLDGDELRFTDVRSHHGSDLLIETLFGSVPFTKIG